MSCWSWSGFFSWSCPIFCHYFRRSSILMKWPVQRRVNMEAWKLMIRKREAFKMLFTTSFKILWQLWLAVVIQKKSEVVKWYYFCTSLINWAALVRSGGRRRGITNRWDGSCCYWPSLWWCQVAFVAAATPWLAVIFDFTSSPSFKTPICFFRLCLC